MPAKSGKSKPVIKNWRESILNENLREDDYVFEVTMIVESSRRSSATIDNIIHYGRKSLDVKPITKDDLVEFLISANYPDSTKEANMSIAILQSASADMSVNELSSDLLAALVKIRMLSYKEDFLAHLELMSKLRKEMEDELKKLANPKGVKDKGKDKKGKDNKSTGKDLGDMYEQTHKGINPDDIINQIKDPNLFRASWIQPDPNITTYFVLCQIYDLDVIEELGKIGVDVNLFVEIGTDYIYLTRDSDDARSLDSVEEIVNAFWDSWSQDNCELSEVLPQHTCYLKFVSSGGLTEEQNFENFKRILCNIDDFRRQYKNYFKNVRFLNVKESKKPVQLECMKVYNALLDQTPNESITIPFLLDSLVEEVTLRIDKNVPPEFVKEAPIVRTKCHGGPSHQIKYLLKKYDCKLRHIPIPVSIPKTINLIYGNIVEYIVGNIRPTKSVNITLDALKRLPPVNLFEMYEKSNSSNVLLYNYLFHKWSDKVKNTSAKELKQCVYSFLFTRKRFSSLNYSKIPPNNSIKSLMFAENKTYNENFVCKDPDVNMNPYERIPIEENVDSPVCNCRYLMPHTCSCEDIPEEYCNMVEELDSTALTQMLNTVYKEYKHFDYKYFAPNDVMLIRFHHNTNLDNLTTEKCANFLRSVFCFRDFCTFILTGDTDWFVQQEHIYWEEKKEEDKKKLEQKIKDFQDQILGTGDNIIEGSLKDKKRKEEAAAKGGKGKDKGADKKSGEKKGKDKAGGSKLAKNEPPERKIVRTSEPYIPKKFPIFDPTKPFPFEVYNLGPSCLQTFDDIIEFHSADGISISIHKQKWSSKDSSYTFDISANNNSIVLHNTLNKILIPDNPFQFHVNVANGIVMVFSKPLVEKKTDVKHVITNLSQKKDPIKSIFSKSVNSYKSSKPYSDMKNTTLENLKIAIENQIPVFKIISSRLHKYQYVKRIKSHIEFPIGKILKRVLCKPKLFLRVKNSNTVKESKCIPYTDLIKDERTELNMDWKATLPTGLLVQTVRAIEPYAFYIKQKYIVHRSDLKSIKDESYRCYLRNGTVMKFLKDGTIKTLTPDKNICHYKYGCFSSNKPKKPSIDAVLNNLQQKKTLNIIPMHFYINNLTRLQKRVKKMCNRFKTHLIDVADNYRFESSREQCRKLHRVYKLSKKIYTNNTCMIPLLNYTVITSQGRIIDVKNNIVYDHEKRYRQMEYTDYLLNETVVHREDGTSWLMNSNGTAVTQFADGTRITTWYSELDQDFILVDSPSVSITSSNEIPSTDKYCQVDPSSNDDVLKFKHAPDSMMRFRNVSADELALLYPSTSRADEIEGYVVLGMNYMYEHPNYATVTYYCTDDVTNVTMPDNIQLTASVTGNYTVHLLNNDSIDVTDRTLEFKASRTCENKTSCKLNISTLIAGDAEEKDNFLYMKDRSSRLFQVSFNGGISNHHEKVDDSSDDILSSLCNMRLSSSSDNERYFVVNRDLSGLELHHDPVPYNFVHTLHNKKGEEEEILLEESYCTTVIQPLRKTYSEHLMMLYDLPVLATTNEKCCIEKLWKLHDLDINSIIIKRKPLFTFKRLINRLPLSVMNAIAQALAKCLSDGTYNTPDITIVERLTQAENDLPPPAIITIPQQEIPLKSKTVKELCKKYRKLINEAQIPQYFDTLRGVCFTTVEECSHSAMEHSSGSPLRIPKLTVKIEEEEEEEEEEEKTEKTKITEVTQYPGILNIPQELTIHLKPDSYTHDIELSSAGIRIVTENYTKEYPFPKSSAESSRSKIEGELKPLPEETVSTALEKQKQQDMKLEKAKRSIPKQQLIAERRTLQDESSSVTDLEKQKKPQKLSAARRSLKKESSSAVDMGKQKIQQKLSAGRRTFNKESSSVADVGKQKIQQKLSAARRTLNKESSSVADVGKQKIQQKLSAARRSLNKESSSVADVGKQKIQQKLSAARRSLNKESSSVAKAEQKPSVKRTFEEGRGSREHAYVEEEEKINYCAIHADKYPICTYDICMCKRPEEKQKKDTKKKCRCQTAICTCSKSRRSDSSITPQCSMADVILLDFKQLAITVIEFFVSNPDKLKILEANLETIIGTTAKTLEIREEDKKNLIDSLKTNIPIYREKAEHKTLTKDDILDILFDVKSIISDIAEKNDDQLNSTELEVIASSINTLITDKSGNTISEIVLDIGEKLKDSNLSSNEMNKVIDIVLKKLMDNKLIIDEEEIDIPKQYLKIVNEINKAIELNEAYKRCCKICGPKKKTQEILHKGSSDIRKDGISTYFCKNPECLARKHVSTMSNLAEDKMTQSGLASVLGSLRHRHPFPDYDTLLKDKIGSFGTTKARKFKMNKDYQALIRQVQTTLESRAASDKRKSNESKGETPPEVEEPVITKRTIVWSNPKPNIYDTDYNRK